jgi:hypothetical protein
MATVNDKLTGALVTVDANSGKYAMQISGATSGDQGVPIETSLPVSARQTSIVASGEQAAPGAGVDIAATTALDSGTWEIEITAMIGGTTVAALEAFNMEVLFNGSSKGRLINPVPGTTGATGPGYFKARYDGAGIILIQAAEAATASSYYAATIVATRIN